MGLPSPRRAKSINCGRPAAGRTGCGRLAWDNVAPRAPTQDSDAFVAPPGGFGTIDEIFESATLIQTHKIHDFPPVLMGRHFWRPLTDFLRGPLEAMALINPVAADRITVTDSAAEAVAAIRDSVLTGLGLRYRAPKRHWFLNE